MRCQLKDGSRTILLSAAEKAALTKAFAIVEQGAFHLRAAPGSSYEVAADALEAILQVDETAEDEPGEEVADE